MREQLRRRTLDAEQGPLYPIPAITSGRLAGTGGNLFQYTYSTSGTRYCFIYNNYSAGGSTGNETGRWSKVFTIPAGEEVKFTLKMLQKSGSTATYPGRVYLKKVGQTANYKALFSTSIKTVGTSRTETFTLEEDVDISDICIGLSNATGCIFEISFVVGDKIYI